MNAPKSLTAPLVVLAAGGTGGHMFPAEALASALIERGLRVALITDLRGAAFGDTLPAVAIYRIRASRLRRDLVDRLHAVMEMALGGWDARRLLRNLKPAIVVGFGGYPSMPTVIAAALQKIPVVLHEQNALLGRANRRLAPRARAIATSFETVKGLTPQTPAVVVGNPVRPGIVGIRDNPYAIPAPDGPVSILIMGGSQGARIFSDVVPAAIALLPPALRARLRIVQQCRPEDIEAVEGVFRDIGVVAELSTFFSDMPRRLADCHLAVARSGASTVAELGVAGRPAILVPYPFATDDHQTLNANAFVRGGAGWVMTQRDFTPEALAAHLEGLMRNPEKLGAAASAARREGRPAAARDFAQFIGALIAPLVQNGVAA
jgi:UDP-N-acetylglucosamine--N-acetylmuramyl-(pentapeptide) pyrophosphoryl-undecaprenol N-acetylglucosamine transferase